MEQRALYQWGGIEKRGPAGCQEELHPLSDPLGAVSDRIKVWRETMF